MYRPNIKGGATFWQDGCNLIETLGAMSDFNIDDHALNSDYIYPYLPHASTPKTDVVTWKLGRSSVTLAGYHRVSFGICLEAPEDNDDLGTIYEYSISMRMGVAESRINNMSNYPFFGQLTGNNAAPVKHIGRSSGSGNRNQACFTPVAAQHSGNLELHASGTVLVKRNISTVNPISQTEGNPIVMGVVVSNIANTSAGLSTLDCHVSGMKYAAPLGLFVPHPEN